MNTQTVLFLYILLITFTVLVSHKIVHIKYKLKGGVALLIGFSGSIYGVVNDYPAGNTEGGSLLICFAGSLFMVVCAELFRTESE